MQLKFKQQTSLKQSLFRGFLKFVLFAVIILFAIFLLDKIEFPFPNKNFTIDLSNEIIKLK